MPKGKRIYLCLAHMSETGEEQKYIKEAFDTNWVVPLGPNVNAFEQELQAFVSPTSALPRREGEAYPRPLPEGKGEAPPLPSPVGRETEVVALSSGTAAVHLALIACGVGPGDEVIVQSFTFCASSNPIAYLGAKPVFVDSERETWNMDPDLLELAIKDRIAVTGRKPKAIVPVALYGMPYQIERIMEIANRYEIPVIEDAAEGFGSRYNGQVLGTFGKYGVLSFNGNKMITTSGGGALIVSSGGADTIMWLATQAREAYPYYQHEAIGYNYRMSNICAGIGRGQMTVANDHIAHHKHVQKLYEELLANVPGIHVHSQPSAFSSKGSKVQGFKSSNGSSPTRARMRSSKVQEFNALRTVQEWGCSPMGGDIEGAYDSNYWLCTIMLDPKLKVKGQENAYKTIVKGAVGGAAGVVHASESAHTDCEPNDNVEALRVFLDQKGIEARPLWKPMHTQPIYKRAEVKSEKLKVKDGVVRQTSGTSVAYVNGVSEEIFKVGMCLPSGPMVTDEDVRYIVECIKEAVG